MRKKIIRAILFFAGLGVVGIVIGGRDLPWFRVAALTINAQSPLTAEELKKFLPPIVGKNLLFLSGGEILEKLKQHPWVASASLQKEYPNRLRINVQTKSPVAAKQEGNKLILIDDKGSEIDRWASRRTETSDLPILSFEKPEQATQWSVSRLVAILSKIQVTLSPKHRISQLVASDPPYFRVFLTQPRLEVLLSLHTWEAQLPVFQELLGRPPRQIGQAHKINLVFPKKAVVSFPLSH